MTIKLAPIILFTYKRLDTLKKNVEALQKNYLALESDLFIFSDGPIGIKDKKEIEKVRAYIKKISGFKTVSPIFLETNIGLANSVIDGVDRVMEKYDKVIVLEDDLVVSMNFLLYMNQALSFYKENQDVFSIAGYTMPIIVPEGYFFDTYLTPRASSWSWGTWKNRWIDIDWSVSSYKEFLTDKVQQQQFSLGGADLIPMLKKQMQGKINSWAIRWCYHQFKRKSLTVYPIISKVQNIGFDFDATNTDVYNRYVTKLDDGLQSTFKFSLEAKINHVLLKQFQKFYSIETRILGRVKTLLYKIRLIKNK